MRFTCAGMAAGTCRPPTDACLAPRGMGRSHTITPENAAPVLGAASRCSMGIRRSSTTSDGHGDPAGTTARAISPDFVTDVGAAREYAAMMVPSGRKRS